MKILLVIVAVFIIYKSVKKSNCSKNNATSPNFETDAAPVIEEALGVINDFLNAGNVVSAFSAGVTDFRGFIVYVPDARPPFKGNKINYGIHICLTSAGNVRLGAQKYPKMLANNPDLGNKYYDFVYKYQNCYNSSEEAYIYDTRKTVLLTKGQEKELMGKLSQQITQKCPLADFHSGMLYTKGVCRD